MKRDQSLENSILREMYFDEGVFFTLDTITKLVFGSTCSEDEKHDYTRDIVFHIFMLLDQELIAELDGPAPQYRITFQPQYRITYKGQDHVHSYLSRGL